MVTHVRQLFPDLQPEPAGNTHDWQHCEHLSELRAFLTPSAFRVPHTALGVAHALPGLQSLFEERLYLTEPSGAESLDPELAEHLYGPVLHSSVSRLEQFAACPFRFFVHSGLRAEERLWFDLDAREQGSFQHEVLAQFHNELAAEAKRWRDVTPLEARERVGTIARVLSATFRNGLLESSQQTRFMARVLTESLQDFVETLVAWMHQQYQFDPVKVEFPFGEDGGPPAWTLELANERRLELYGRIDRIDLYRPADGESALCVVVDYKSSQKQLDPVLVEHGIQLQLLTYLNVLRQWPNPLASFGAARLEPAGVFYVNLRGKYGRERNRRAALADPQAARKLAYRHTGRFDARALPYLDSRAGVIEGDQFNYRLTRGGLLHKRCKEPVPTEALESLLDQIETNLHSMGSQVYSGRAEVAPFRKGIMTACDQCGYQAICRFDPWTQSYRVLRPSRQDDPAPEP